MTCSWRNSPNGLCEANGNSFLSHMRRATLDHRPAERVLVPRRGPGGGASGWNAACQSLSTWYTPGQVVVSAALDVAACRDLNKAPLLEKIQLGGYQRMNSLRSQGALEQPPTASDRQWPEDSCAARTLWAVVGCSSL